MNSKARITQAMEHIERILVVDDTPMMLEFLKVSLQKSVFEFEHIYTANNGEEAIDVLKQKTIDLVLTDINMPVLDGIGLLKYMNNHPVFKDIPAIAVTAEYNEKYYNMLTFWGHGYLRKPFKINMLEEQILKYYTKDYEYNLHG